jgi:hypothetical protein
MQLLSGPRQSLECAFLQRPDQFSRVKTYFGGRTAVTSREGSLLRSSVANSSAFPDNEFVSVGAAALLVGYCLYNPSDSNEFQSPDFAGSSATADLIHGNTNSRWQRISFPPAKPIVLCESEPPVDGSTEDQDDPYANLPEDDEPTDCSMCNTFRVGPCRPYWRKLERCFKDFDSKDADVASNCMRYFEPHTTCLSKYNNLYHLVSLALKQDFISDVELSIEKDDERQGFAPVVDWAMWQSFLKDMGGYQKYLQRIHDFVLVDSAASNSANDSKAATAAPPTPLWKLVPENTEPMLVTVTAALDKEFHGSATKLPKKSTTQRKKKKNKKSGPEPADRPLLLKAAYAVDQEGRVLGFHFDEYYGDRLKLVKEKDAAKSETPDGETAEKESSSASSSGDAASKAAMPATESKTKPFEFFLLPGSTTSVKICALYAEDPVFTPTDKDILDAMLLESEYMSVGDRGT